MWLNETLNQPNADLMNLLILNDNLFYFNELTLTQLYI